MMGESSLIISHFPASLFLFVTSEEVAGRHFPVLNGSSSTPFQRIYEGASFAIQAASSLSLIAVPAPLYAS